MDSVVLIKIVSALCYPVGLVSTLIFAWLLSRLFGYRQLSHLFSVLAVVILLLASNHMVARWLVAGLENQYPQQAVEDFVEHDAILVLGGGLRAPTAPAKYTQLTSGSDRYLYALRLYRAGKAKRIVISGGNVFPKSGVQGEAFYASKLLQSWGVPTDAIIAEQGSRTTLQNQQKVKSHLQTHQIKTALLVTSAYHMPRSHMIFKELPVAMTPAPADIILSEHYIPSILNWIPSSAALQLTTRALHEYYGIAVLKLNALRVRGD